MLTVDKELKLTIVKQKLKTCKNSKNEFIFKIEVLLCPVDHKTNINEKMLSMWGNIDLELEVDSRTTDIADLQRDKSKCVESKDPDATVDLFQIEEYKRVNATYKISVLKWFASYFFKLLQDFIDLCLLILH